jgi:hypothetical protein
MIELPPKQEQDPMTATITDENTWKDQTRLPEESSQNPPTHHYRTKSDTSVWPKQNNFSWFGHPPRTTRRQHRREKNTNELVEKLRNQPAHPHGKAGPYIKEINNESSTTIMNWSPMNTLHNQI